MLHSSLLPFPLSFMQVNVEYDKIIDGRRGRVGVLPFYYIPMSIRSMKKRQSSGWLPFRRPYQCSSPRGSEGRGAWVIFFRQRIYLNFFSHFFLCKLAAWIFFFFHYRFFLQTTWISLFHYCFFSANYLDFFSALS